MRTRTKKIILWSSTLILATILLFFWVGSAKRSLEGFRGEGFIKKINFPKIEMPKFEIPNIENAEKTSTTTE